jgi:hypothetical protein
MAITRLQAAPSPTQETNNAAYDLLPQRKPLPAATDLHIHIRAEKSYSDVNRVICDETTSFITTSTRPFTVRHTTLTSTFTFYTYHFHTTVTESFVSTTTATQYSTAYEETTTTIPVTETITSQIVETTTETPTVEATDQPRPTVYAACGPDNIIGGIRNHGIVNINPLPFNRFFLTIQPEQATGPESCCETCILDAAEICAASFWEQGSCYHVIRRNSQCNGGEAINAFDLSSNAAFDSRDLVVSNGVCGQQVWSGKYCDVNGLNCAAPP